MAAMGAKARVERLMAVLRYRVRSKMEVEVLDLSEGGCMVDSRGLGAKPEERLLVKLPGLGEVGAKIVWIENQRAGLAFEEPLYTPVLENLVTQM